MGCCGSKRNQQELNGAAPPIEDRLDPVGYIEYEPESKPRHAGAPLSADEKLQVSERKHRPIFNLPPHERLINVFRCQKIGANAQQGKLYLWEAHVCFKSPVETHVIPLSDVLLLKVVNEYSTLVLNTRNDQFFFSFEQAPVVYEMLMEWKEHQPRDHSGNGQGVPVSMQDPHGPHDYGRDGYGAFDGPSGRHLDSMLHEEDPPQAHTATVNLISRNPSGAR